MMEENLLDKKNEIRSAVNCLTKQDTEEKTLRCDFAISTMSGDQQSEDIKPSQMQTVQLEYSKKNQCTSCGHSFTRRSTLRRHMAKLHNEVLPSDRPQVKHKCLHHNCSKVFVHITVMLQHLKDQHGDAVDETEYEFDSMDDFKQWKEVEESQNYVFFAKSGAADHGKHYFVCQRHGSQRSHRSKNEPARKTERRNKRGSVKSNMICPARMFVRLNEAGKVSVKYIHSHNHPVMLKDTVHQPIPATLRAEIKAKLASGVKKNDILQDLREGSDEQEHCKIALPLKRKYLVSKQQLQGMKRHKYGKKRLHSEDVTSTKLKVDSLIKEHYNPILMYKARGDKVQIGNGNINNLERSNNIFILALQTKEQCDMLELHGRSLLLIDTMYSSTQYDVKLVNLVIVDEFNSGYPVGHLLTTSTHQVILENFFSIIKKRKPSLKLSAFMTDDDDSFFNAINTIFGKERNLTRFLCKWSTHHAWKKRLREELPTNSNLRTELYRHLVIMREEKDQEAFSTRAMQLIVQYQTVCPSFVKYINDTFFKRSQEWAMCYRDLPNVTSGMDTSVFVESLHNRLKHYYSLTEPDRRVDDLLDLLLTIETDDYWRHRGQMDFQIHIPQEMSCHDKGMLILDHHVIPGTSLSTWDLLPPHGCTVSKIQDDCPNDSCNTMCLDVSCVGLCRHLYTCSCSDVMPLCQHVHKVHSIQIKRFRVDHPMGSMNIIQEEVEHEDYDVVVFHSGVPAVPSTCTESQPQVDAIISQTEVLKSHLENAKVRQLLLPYVSETLSKLITQCAAVINAAVVEVSQHSLQEEERILCAAEPKPVVFEVIPPIAAPHTPLT